mmetsp:Transcript_385/g.599  ORF Transcript_385/g.599 Transcript_385/m.599 type:complete len:200 (+) Transcript_385:146-745(+)
MRHATTRGATLHAHAAAAHMVSTTTSRAAWYMERSILSVGSTVAATERVIAAMAIRPLITSACSVKPHGRSCGTSLSWSLVYSRVYSLTMLRETGLPSLICCMDGRARSGSASVTTVARASMKPGSVPSVGTRTKERIPTDAACAAASQSISLSVPMCSKTKEMGTSTIASVPAPPSREISSAVDGSIQRSRDGPNWPW